MFARTERLLLRPGFPEDAAALSAAFDRPVMLHLATPPFRELDGATWLAVRQEPHLPRCLIIERGAEPQLVGTIVLVQRARGDIELAYWLRRSVWGRGYATEAVAAMLAYADSIGIGRIEAAHFIDNPASQRVLEKMGFEPTGLAAPRHCLARGGMAMARVMSRLAGGLRLTDEGPGPIGGAIAA